MTPQSQNSAIVAVAVGGVISVAVAGEGWDLVDSMVGLLLSMLLIAYGSLHQGSLQGRSELWTVSAVIAFCGILILGVLISFLPSPAQPWAGVWHIVFWVGFTWAVASWFEGGKVDQMYRWCLHRFKTTRFS